MEGCRLLREHVPVPHVAVAVGGAGCYLGAIGTEGAHEQLHLFLKQQSRLSSH